MRFAYKGIKEDGTAISDFVEADSKVNAILALQEEKITPLEVKSLEEAKTLSWKLFLERLSGPKHSTTISINTAALMMFFIKLEKMYAGGMTLADALSSIIKRASTPSEKAFAKQIYLDITSGTTFAEALKHTNVQLDHNVFSMLETGEMVGNLRQALNDGVKYLKSRAAFKKSLISSLIYPCFMTVVAYLVMCAFTFVFLPMMFNMMTTSGGSVQLPTITKVVVVISKTAIWGVPIFVILVIPLSGVIRQLRKKNETFRYNFDKNILNCPIYGSFALLSMRTGVSNLLSMLLGCGVTMAKALDMVRKTINNAYLHKNFVLAMEDILNGKGVAVTFEKFGIFEGEVCDLIDVGERTADVGSCMSEIYETYNQALVDKLGWLKRVINSAIMGFVFAFIGAFAISMVMMLTSMSSAF